MIVAGRWVAGPYPLEGLRLMDVDEGSIMVLLRNGKAIDVRTPGRHGGMLRILSENRVPMTGIVKYLMFENAPAASEPLTMDVRLRDGATVPVTVSVAIEPLWKRHPEQVLATVQTYGVDAKRIEAIAHAHLKASIQQMVVGSLRDRTHAEVHQFADQRALMRVPPSKGLLRIGDVLSVTIGRDAHEEDFVLATRDAGIERVRAGIQAELNMLRARSQNQIDAIRRAGQIAGRAEEAKAQMQLDLATAKILGIPRTDVVYPHQRDARLIAQHELVRSILGDNLDLVPLLADSSFQSGLRNIQSLIGGEGGRQAQVQTLPQLSSGPAQVQLLHRVCVAGPCGTQEILLIGAGPDRVIGSIRVQGPGKLMVRTGNPVDMALRSLTHAANWSGVKIVARVDDSSDHPLILITRVIDDAHAAPEALSAVGAWINAINAVLRDAFNGGAEVRVNV